ncbi:MAG: cytochrome P450 [Actinomycetota bacterium]|nr:cytochrome P450 [Actinomycetota bacterium]
MSINPNEEEQDEPGGLGMGDPESNRNPQRGYKMLRDVSPVVTISGVIPSRENADAHLVGRHADVLSVLRNPEVFSSRFDAVHIGQVRPLIPLQIDPPDHSKYRKLLDPLFAPRRIALLEDRTRSLVAGLVDRVVEDGECNFHDAVAEPLPSTVFLELLGLPVSRAAEFLALKDGIIRPEAETPEQRSEIVDATGAQIYAVLEEVVEQRLAAPQDDFISSFLSAEVDGHQLTSEEVIDICYLFFLAGLDTVTASLDCMMARLAQNPGERRRLVDDPEIISLAVEEMLRWETPVTSVVRVTTQETELSGCPIGANEVVSVMIGSANTDERAWDNPDLVDADRQVNKHLAFGGGVHRCLGSHLARMELRVTLEEWHARIPDYHIPDGVELDYSPSLRQIANLPLAW